MKHHSQPRAGLARRFGLALIWIGYRLMVPPTYRLAFMGAGGALAR